VEASTDQLREAARSETLDEVRGDVDTVVAIPTDVGDHGFTPFDAILLLIKTMGCHV